MRSLRIRFPIRNPLYKAVPYKMISIIKKFGLRPVTGRTYLAGGLNEVGIAATELYGESMREGGLVDVSGSIRKWGIFQIVNPKCRLTLDPRYTRWAFPGQSLKYYYTEGPHLSVKLIGIYDARTGYLKYSNGIIQKIAETFVEVD